MHAMSDKMSTYIDELTFINKDAIRAYSVCIGAWWEYRYGEPLSQITKATKRIVSAPGVLGPEKWSSETVSWEPLVFAGPRSTRGPL